MNTQLVDNTMTFSHFGIAVTDFEQSVSLYRQMGYVCSEPVYDPIQNVELVMCNSDTSPDIELVKPVADTSPVRTFLKTGSEAFYHLCFEVDDISKTVERIKKTHRIMCIKNAQPAVLFGNRNVSFYYIGGVGIYEFLEVER